jgi:cbb3-type cytochrome oxidase maturation protein
MTLDDFIVYAVLIGSVVIFGGAAVLALAWAVRDGQFENFDRSARRIFDPDEPIGKPTDYFPDMSPNEDPLTLPSPQQSQGRG